MPLENRPRAFGDVEPAGIFGNVGQSVFVTSCRVLSARKRSSSAAALVEINMIKDYHDDLSIGVGIINKATIASCTNRIFGGHAPSTSLANLDKGGRQNRGESAAILETTVLTQFCSAT